MHSNPAAVRADVAADLAAVLAPGAAEGSFVVMGSGPETVIDAAGVHVLRAPAVGAPAEGPRGMPALEAWPMEPPPEARTDRLSAGSEPPAAVPAVTFVGGRADARPEGTDPAATVVSHLGGTRPRAGMPTFRGAVQRDVWPGVDVHWRIEGEHLAATVVVAPGADAAAVRIAFGPAAERPGTAAVELGLASARRDPDRPLVVDMGALVYAGLWGLPAYDRGLGIAVGDDGAAYFTGEAWIGGKDRQAFVVKVTPSGDAVSYVAFVGGTGQDAGFDIDVDAAGNAYVAGATSSSGPSLGVVGGPDLTANGASDALVFKLDPTGTRLVYAGFIGGRRGDFAEGIRVDGHGAAYVTGVTSSDQTTFPVKVGPDVTYNGGENDAFIVKVVPEPRAEDVAGNLVYAGYVGGARGDCYYYRPADRPLETWATAGHVALDADGNAYMSGATESGPDTFPDGDGLGDLPSPDRTYSGAWDAYVVKIKAGGEGLSYAGYLGGDADELGFGMGVDAAGAAYYGGFTASGEETFGPVVGPDLTYNGGPLDSFAVKVQPDGRAYAYAGYVGGPGEDGAVAVAVGADGELLVVGYTDSADGFPLVAGPDLTLNSHEPKQGDAFVARLVARPDAADPAANYVYSGYIGGGAWDQAFWVDVDPSGAAYVVGDTWSDAATFPDGGGLAGRTAPSTDAPGEGDTFVVKVAGAAVDVTPGTPGPTHTARTPESTQTPGTQRPTQTPGTPGPTDPAPTPEPTGTGPVPARGAIYLPSAARG